MYAFIVANVTPSQLRQLDAAAKGEAAASPELLRQVDQQQMKAADGMKSGDFSFLQPYCPDDVPTFNKYIRQ